ncbi:dihydrodipicolinate synthase family protein [Mycobacterium sp. BMJ-28]
MTLFDDNGTLLTDKTADLAAMLVDHGAASILVAGTAGEFWLLGDDERLQLTAAIRRSVGDDVPVIGHVGGVDAKRSAGMAERMESAGASAVIALPLNIGANDVAGYYEKIGATTSLPVLAYLLPQAGVSIPLDVLQRLSVVGIKDSSGDGERLTSEVVDLSIETYTGAPSLLGLAHDAGAAGAILGLSNARPELAAEAFGGSRDAFRAMMHEFAVSAAEFPANLKRITAERWNTPVGSRSAASAGNVAS